jgi:hypothetical protein
MQEAPGAVKKRRSGGVDGRRLRRHLYANLAPLFPNGYQQLGLGIASSTSNPRGLQPPDIYTVYENLLALGTSVYAIWCAEDSVLTDPPYTIENTLISIAEGTGT